MRIIDVDVLIKRIEDDIRSIEDEEPVMAMGAIGVLNMIKEASIIGKLNNPDDSLISDLISRQAAIEAIEKAYCNPCKERGDDYNGVRCRACNFDDAICQIDALPPVEPKRPKVEWVLCSEPPKDRRNVFLAHGTNDFKSCCIGHYEQGMGWYEDRNFFAKPIYDCKYWCDIPDLPDMGDNQFDMRGDKE